MGNTRLPRTSSSGKAPPTRPEGEGASGRGGRRALPGREGLTGPRGDWYWIRPKVYTVRMKRMTATEARRHWFRLLDEVAAGEEILIERDGARLVLKIADLQGPAKVPDYQGLIRIPDADQADQWGWEWDGSPAGLKTRKTRSEP